MDERNLERLVQVALLRVRLNAGVRWACITLMACLLFAAVLVAVARLYPALEPLIAWNNALIAVVLGAFVAGTLLTAPKENLVLAELDRRGKLNEHLVTWAYLRRADAPKGAVEKFFHEAQRAATLRLAGKYRARHLLPLKLPAWSHMLWLGLLALGCALLMPQQKPEPTVAATKKVSDENIGLRLKSGGEGLGGDTQLKVKPLSATEMKTLELYVLDPNLALEEKKSLYEDISARVAGIPESQLDQDLRQYLKELRNQVKADQGEKPVNGTQTNEGKPGNEKPKHVAVTPMPVKPLDRAQLAGVAHDSFPDVEPELRRYYGLNNSEKKAP